MSISRSSFVFVGAVIAVLPSTAFAQEQPPPPPPPQAQPQPPPPPPPPQKVDGVRFRGGISLAGGGEFASQGSTNLSFGMGGLDGRIGVQINNIFGIYAQPHLSFGGGSGGSTGTFAATALADFTFIDRIFVAAGGGYGLANNPSGPALHFRAGAYPLMGRSDGSIVRKGLMVGIDARMIFVEQAGSGFTVVQIMGAVGYEAF